MKILQEVALTYDDVLLVPQYSAVDSRRKLSTQTRLTNQIALQIPIVSANMDVVTDPYQFVLARNAANIRTLGAPSYNDQFVAAVKKYSENPIPENEWGVVDGALHLRRDHLEDLLAAGLHDLAETAADLGLLATGLGARGKEGTATDVLAVAHLAALAAQCQFDEVLHLLQRGVAR